MRAIIADLEAACYLTRTRVGRRTVYAIHPDRPFRQPAQDGYRIGPFLELLAAPGDRAGDAARTRPRQRAVTPDALLAHPAVRAAAAAGRPGRHSGEVPVACVVPGGPGPFDETELSAWAGTAIGEAAARPRRIYRIAQTRPPRAPVARARQRSESH